MFLSKKHSPRENWRCEEKDKLYICPNNREVVFKQYSRQTDWYGQVRDFKIYEYEDCTGCLLKVACTKAAGSSSSLQPCV